MTGASEASAPKSGAPSVAGRLVWITGLAASGKTTVGRLLLARMRARGDVAVLLDGDALRDAFEYDLGYSLEDRRRSAWRYARLARLLAKQGVDVVVATISMFEEVRRWNRARNERYLEVYLRTSVEECARRDRRGVYEGESVVGIDVSFEEPTAADVLVEVTPQTAPEDVVELILDHAPVSAVRFDGEA